jgi:HEAT repeat protein
MLSGIFGWRFDWPEFVLGILFAAAAFWGLGRLRPTWLSISEWGRGHLQRVSEGLAAGAKDKYRADLQRRAQTLHAARVLFPLSDIVVPPRLLAPPPPVDPDRPEQGPETSLGVLPNLPDWTVLSGIYGGTSLSLSDVIHVGASVLLTGELGSGKSTALAYLALRFSSTDHGTPTRFPVLVHASDFRREHLDGKDPIEALISAAQQCVPSSLTATVAANVRSNFRGQRGLLLLDGLDELHPIEIPPFGAWLERLMGTYPGNLVIAAGPATGYDGLAHAGLTPAPIAPWTEHDRRIFLARWAAAWQKYVTPNASKSRLGDIDPTLVNGWILGSLRALLPIEVVARTWSAYAGDARGASLLDALDTYVDRFVSQEERQVAESAAAAWITEKLGAVSERALRRGTPIPDLAEAGIFTRRPGNRVSFSIPAVGAYLAARAMVSAGAAPPETDLTWLPAAAAVRWFSRMGDITPLVTPLLQRTDDPLETGLLSAARFLAEAPPKAAWRAQALRALATIVQTEDRPYGLRLRATHALVGAREATVAILFRRLLASEAIGSQILAALALGGMSDEESIKPLLTRAQSDRELLVRHAACLALGAIGTDAALEGLGHLLLGSAESVRLAAAEALATHPDEGFGMLRDASEVDNLLTRRAAVFGLSRVPEPWAVEVLEKMQVDDQQWVVRGAAAEALERRKNPPWKLRRPARDASELPWLVAFAARQGLGVAPGRAAFEMVRRSLSQGTADEQAAALEALGWLGGAEFSLELTRALQAPDPHLRDMAFEALWRLAASGEPAPARAPASA